MGVDFGWGASGVGTSWWVVCCLVSGSDHQGGLTGTGNYGGGYWSGRLGRVLVKRGGLGTMT